MGGAGGITLASKISGSGPITYAGTGTLALTNANTYSGGTTINPGGTMLLTNSAAAAGTGAITDNGTLDVGIPGNNVMLANAISGPGIVNMMETAGNNLQLAGSMSGFTGTINCPASASTAKVQILTATVALTSAATINVAAGGTFYIAYSAVSIPCALNLGGLGNSEVYGALRIESNALVSGPVTLGGNTTIGNGAAAGNGGTISGAIGDGGHGYGITKTLTPGTLVLSGTNTFTGPTTINSNTLTIGGSGCLGVTATATNYANTVSNNGVFNYNSSAAQILSGVVSGTGALIQSGPGVLTLSGSNSYTGGTLITNGATLVLGGSGGLGVTGTATNYGGAITNDGTFNYASSAAQTLSGVVSGTGVLMQSGSGTLTLSGADTYTGGTVISNGSTLALGSGGSINTTPSISIAAGATLDVSAYASYSLLGGTTLSASGSGAGAGPTAATIKGAASGGATVTLVSPIVLTFTPQTFNGDATHPALYVSQISSGELNLSGNAITISNAAATALGAGTYSLIQVAAGGAINLGSPSVTVTGSGLAPGTTASLSVSGGSVNLIVVTTVVPVPAINSVTLSGASLIFSGANGPDSGNYYVLSSTNLALPLTNWTVIATNAFSPTGTFSVTNVVGASPTFFVIEVH